MPANYELTGLPIGDYPSSVLEAKRRMVSLSQSQQLKGAKLSYLRTQEEYLHCYFIDCFGEREAIS
jgi:hypothetical protein